MSVKSLEGGRYKVDVRPRGTSGRRIQRVFDKKADAVAFEKYVLAHHHDKEWLQKPADIRRLDDLISPWWELHGRNLTHGEKRKRALERISEQLGNPIASRIDKKLVMQYRSERLFDGVKATTINRDIYVLSGMFTVLIDAEDYAGENPLHSIKDLKADAVEMTYLTSDEITDLLHALRYKDEELRITVLCLSTGARWGEASSLTAENIIHNRVTFTETKNGKKRTVPVSEEVERMVKTRQSGKLFRVSYASYRNALRKVKPDLPSGQAVHVLRHTFAAHFIMNGGNIITLQRILGHSTIQQTMTYAHLAPDFLYDATRLNPLDGNIHISSTFLGSHGIP